MRQSSSRGFSLMEIVIAVSIIAILIALPILAYTNYLKNARDSKRKSDLNNVRSALELYRANTGAYPSISDFPSALIDRGYLAELPIDPKDGELLSTNSGLSYGYAYSPSGDLQSYQMAALLERKEAGATATQASYYTVTPEGEDIVNKDIGPGGTPANGNIAGTVALAGTVTGGSFTGGTVSGGVTVNGSTAGTLNGTVTGGTAVGTGNGSVSGTVTVSGTSTNGTFTGTFSGTGTGPGGSGAVSGTINGTVTTGGSGTPANGSVSGTVTMNASANGGGLSNGTISGTVTLPGGATGSLNGTVSSGTAGGTIGNGAVSGEVSVSGSATNGTFSGTFTGTGSSSNGSGPVSGNISGTVTQNSQLATPTIIGGGSGSGGGTLIPTSSPGPSPTATRTPTPTATRTPTPIPPPATYVRTINQSSLTARINRSKLTSTGIYFGGVRDLGYNSSTGNNEYRFMAGYMPHSLSPRTFAQVSSVRSYSFLPNGIGGNIVPLAAGGMYMLSGAEIIKLNSSFAMVAGSIQFTNATAENSYTIYDGVEIDSNNYVFVGSTNQNYYNGTRSHDAFIVKVNAAGAIQWATTIGADQGASDAFYRVVKSGTDVIVAGESGEYSVPLAGMVYGPYVVKFNGTTGAVTWQSKINKGTAVNNQVYDIDFIAASDGGFVYTARSYPGDSIILIKYSSAGAIQWATSYPVTAAGGSSGLAETSDGYVTSFLTNGANRDVNLLKVQKANGTSTWMRRFGAAADEHMGGLGVDSSDSLVGVINSTAPRLFRMSNAGAITSCSELVTVTNPTASAWTYVTVAAPTTIASTATVQALSLVASGANTVTLANSCN